MKRNAIIGQSGGPTAVINASLAGVIKEAKERGFHHIYGMFNGIQGLMNEKIIDLSAFDDEKLRGLAYTPAMYLGSCRYKLPEKDDDLYDRVFSILKKLEITDFFYIGGNDSMDTVMKLSGYAQKKGADIHFIGIPKTIDNDLFGTDHTPGFGSAAKFVAGTVLEVIYDSRIYKVKSVTIVEIMGRNAGWLTASAALARSAVQDRPDLIYLPEVPFDINRYYEDIAELFKTRNNIIVAVSEGIKDEDGHFIDEKRTAKDVFGNTIHGGVGKLLEELTLSRFGCKVRSIELNVLQRCNIRNASLTDLKEAVLIGEEAVRAALKGETGKMMVFKRSAPYQIDVACADVNDIANQEKTIPLSWVAPNGHDIGAELYDYLTPLIQGEVALPYENGVPVFMDIRHLI